MKKILLVGEQDEFFIAKFLQRHPSYVFLSSSGVRLRNLDKEAVFIYDTGHYFVDLSLRYDMILFKNSRFENFPLKESLLNPIGKIFLFSENQKAKNMLNNQKIPYRTIGFQEGDVSVSSITEDGVTFFCCKQGNEYFVQGNYFPTGIYPVVAGELTSLLLTSSI